MTNIGKFRAKTKEGETVEGYYCRSKGLETSEIYHIMIEKGKSIGFEGDYTLILPETLEPLFDGWVKQDIDKDVAFLKEMKWHFGDCLTDITHYEMLGKMINDWLHELESKQPPPKKEG